MGVLAVLYTLSRPPGLEEQGWGVIFSALLSTGPSFPPSLCSLGELEVGNL